MADENPKSFISTLKDASDETEKTVKLHAAIPAGFVLPDVAARATPTTALKPGVERWQVKTGTDPDVASVGKDGIVDTTVEELINIPRPKDFQPPTQRTFPKYEDHRSAPVETTIWRLKADVIAVKLEADGDFHLVLQGVSGETMVGEIPDPLPDFIKTTSPFFADVKAARAAAQAKLLGQVPGAMTVSGGDMLMPTAATITQPAAHTVNPTAALTAAAAPGGGPLTFKTKVKPQPVTVTGVGFFDAVHGQMGVSQLNGIELHPILKIEFGP